MEWMTGGLSNEAHDAHSLAARAQQWVDLVDTSDGMCPRFPAGTGLALLSVHNRVKFHFAGHSFKRV